jgi:hypothetical protein
VAISEYEVHAAAWQPALVAGQAFKADVDAIAGGHMMNDVGSETRLSNMFDLLDPNHPSLVSRGLAQPDESVLNTYIREHPSH